MQALVRRNLMLKNEKMESVVIWSDALFEIINWL